MPDELLKQTLETTEVALTSVRGPKTPTVDTEVTYTCVVKPRKNLRNLTVDFGFFESPREFGYVVSSFHPEPQQREPGTIVVGPSPARARRIATLAAPATANTSFPFTLSPGSPKADALPAMSVFARHSAMGR